jgi:hypothetical protein
MITPLHPGKGCHGHVAGDALIARTIFLVERMCHGVLYPLLMAWRTGLVGVIFMPVSSTGGVTMQTIQPTGLYTRAQ